MIHLDVLIIGAGTAGEYAAGTAKQFTDSVGMIEKGPVGGECIFHACIPTKALVHAARTYKKMKNADFFGLPTLDKTADYREVKAFKDRIVIGAEASSLIHEVATAMVRGLTVSNVGNTLHAYPTLSEGVRYACQAIM